MEGIAFSQAEQKRNELESNLDALSSICRIANYCAKLIGGIELKFQRGIKTMETIIDKA